MLLLRHTLYSLWLKRPLLLLLLLLLLSLLHIGLLLFHPIFGPLDEQADLPACEARIRVQVRG